MPAVVLEREGSGYGEQTLLVKRPGRRATVVDRGGSGEENDQELTTPSFAGPYLYWGFANHGPYVRTKRSYVFRRRLATGAETGTRLTPYVTSVSADPGRPGAPLVLTTDDALDSPEDVRGEQEVRVLDQPSWRRVPRRELVY